MTTNKTHRRRCARPVKAWLLCVWALPALLLWTGCSGGAGWDVVEDFRTPDHWATYIADSAVECDFGFICSKRHHAATKMTTATVQLDNGFRGLQNIQLIPFLKQGVITANDQPTVEGQVSGLSVLNTSSLSSRFFYYNNTRFAPGVASFLLYARAYVQAQATDIQTKLYNGSLLSDYSQGLMPANIRFVPEAIYSDDTEAPAAAEALAGYLTYIAEARGIIDEGGENETILRWNATTQSELRAYYQNFIKEDNTGSLLMAGASPNVMALVNELYSKVGALSFEANSIEEALQDDILSRISTYTGVTFDNVEGEVTSLGDMDGYPASIGLPDGAAVLRWSSIDGQFEPQMQTTTLAAINAASRFVYPAELWYRANSRIKTSDSRDKQDIYATNTVWSSVLDAYEHTNGIVDQNTRSLALIDPAQYAVACLHVMLKGTTATLKDAMEDDITVGSGLFPLTAVIVGSQRPVDFEFKPIGSSEADDGFAYDPYVKNGANWLSLGTSDAAAPTQTLVVQSRDGEAVKVALEFQNNSASDFKGVNGTVYRGTKFYLVGELTPPADPSQDYQRRVFTQDYTTTANMTVSSLANAYNVMPDLLSPKLEIGVQVTTQWEEASSTPVPIVY